MGKPGRRRKPRPKPEKGPCFKVFKKEEGAESRCGNRGVIVHHCRICEDLAAAGKLKGEPYKIQTCVHHHDEAVQEIKKHALVAHPVNLLRAGVAALKGEL